MKLNELKEKVFDEMVRRGMAHEDERNATIMAMDQGDQMFEVFLAVVENEADEAYDEGLLDGSR